jgi:hypothetical protein
LPVRTRTPSALANAFSTLPKTAAEILLAAVEQVALIASPTGGSGNGQHAEA